jgi:hypothetical protein
MTPIGEQFVPAGYELEFLKSALALIVAAFSLAATWFIGLRLTAYWNLRQKRNELNQVSLQAFHALYGEFKEGVKIWRLAKRRLTSPVRVPEDERWTLLARACAIESKSEALVLRLTAERCLSTDEIAAIGLFRQAIQTLRESIRDNVDCPLGSRKAEYKLLNQLAPRVATIVSAELPKRIPSAEQARRQLDEVVKVTSKRWKQMVAEMQRAGLAPEEDEEDA